LEVVEVVRCDEILRRVVIQNPAVISRHLSIGQNGEVGFNKRVAVGNLAVQFKKAISQLSPKIIERVVEVVHGP